MIAKSGDAVGAGAPASVQIDADAERPRAKVARHATKRQPEQVVGTAVGKALEDADSNKSCQFLISALQKELQ